MSNLRQHPVLVLILLAGGIAALIFSPDFHEHRLKKPQQAQPVVRDRGVTAIEHQTGGFEAP